MSACNHGETRTSLTATSELLECQNDSVLEYLPCSIGFDGPCEQEKYFAAKVVGGNNSKALPHIAPSEGTRVQLLLLLL